MPSMSLQIPVSVDTQRECHEHTEFTMKKQLLFRAVALAASLSVTSALAGPVAEVVSGSDIDFVPLNPARGDASPQAGVLWGDIRKDVPSGVLLKFADGFSSPPHIHNVTYRAVVINGAVHNDDPEAANMWMGPGSFWIQPAGELHITSAQSGPGASAFLEILEGPYLVQRSDQAFANGERPMNLEESNVVWLTPKDVTWISQTENAVVEDEVKISFLWGRPDAGELNGTFLKLPPGFEGELIGNDAWLRAIVIRGRTTHRLANASEATNLLPGSYFGSKGRATHRISCAANEDCLLYVRTQGKYELKRI